LELPAGARDVRLGGKAIAETLLTLRNNQLSGGLGPAEKLELSWRPAHAAAAAAALAADGVVTARLDARELTTEARLTLRVLTGQAGQWRLRLPPDSKLAVAAADEGRVEKIDHSRGKLV